MERALYEHRTPDTRPPRLGRTLRTQAGFYLVSLGAALLLTAPIELRGQVRQPTPRADDRRVAALEQAAVERLRGHGWEVPRETRAVIRDLARLGLDILEITSRTERVPPPNLETSFLAVIDSASRSLRAPGQLPTARVLPRNEFAQTIFAMLRIRCWFWPFCYPGPMTQGALIQ